MEKLNDLTVPLLNRLAKECGVQFKKGAKKPDKIATLENAGIPKEKMEQLITKYLAKKGIKKRSSKDTILELKGRIRLLEDQVRFLMSKISVTEVKILKDKDRDLITITSNLSDIKKFIKSMLSPGESITIDDLIEIKELQKIPLITVKHAIYDLIEEGIFEVSEGSSRQKIGGKIGLLTRL
ncbi:MAG: hypothetical protein ACFFAK_15930 [Promethearchaeota archaeon]